MSKGQIQSIPLPDNSVDVIISNCVIHLLADRAWRMPAPFFAEGLDVDGLARSIDGTFMSAFIRATKPTPSQSCCGPTCCS